MDEKKNVGVLDLSREKCLAHRARKKRSKDVVMKPLGLPSCSPYNQPVPLLIDPSRVEIKTHTHKKKNKKKSLFLFIFYVSETCKSNRLFILSFLFSFQFGRYMKGESWKDIELVGMMKTFTSFVDLTTNLGLLFCVPSSPWIIFNIRQGHKNKRLCVISISLLCLQTLVAAMKQRDARPMSSRVAHKRGK